MCARLLNGKGARVLAAVAGVALAACVGREVSLPSPAPGELPPRNRIPHTVYLSADMEEYQIRYILDGIDLLESEAGGPIFHTVIGRPAVGTPQTVFITDGPLRDDRDAEARPVGRGYLIVFDFSHEPRIPWLVVHEFGHIYFGKGHDSNPRNVMHRWVSHHPSLNDDQKSVLQTLAVKFAEKAEQSH